MKARFRIQWEYDYMYLFPPVIGYHLVPLNFEAECQELLCIYKVANELIKTWQTYNRI